MIKYSTSEHDLEEKSVPCFAMEIFNLLGKYKSKSCSMYQ
jgi:hypothetical protein